jgi:hypothetical protein
VRSACVILTKWAIRILTDELILAFRSSFRVFTKKIPPPANIYIFIHDKNFWVTTNYAILSIGHHVLTFFNTISARQNDLAEYLLDLLLLENNMCKNVFQ